MVNILFYKEIQGEIQDEIQDEIEAFTNNKPGSNRFNLTANPVRY